MVFRADGHHSKPEVLAWLEREGLRHVIGYAPNAVLKQQSAACISQAAKRYEQHVKEGRAEVEVRAFASGSYSAGSWHGKQRRIICRTIAGPHGVDKRLIQSPPHGSFTPPRLLLRAVCLGPFQGPRHIVTGFEDAGAQMLYEDIYCGRGRAELYLKDHKLGLVSDRLSCTRKEGNAMRLLCSSLAYQVLEGFRRVALAGTQLARATFGELSMKIFKLVARLRVMKTRVEMHLAARHPGSRLGGADHWAGAASGRAQVRGKRKRMNSIKRSAPAEKIGDGGGGAMPGRSEITGFERRSAPSARRNSFKHPPCPAFPLIQLHPCWLHE